MASLYADTIIMHQMLRVHVPPQGSAPAMKTFAGSDELRGLSAAVCLLCMSHLRNARARCLTVCTVHVSARLGLSLRHGVYPRLKGVRFPARGSAAETQKTCG